MTHPALRFAALTTLLAAGAVALSSPPASAKSIFARRDSAAERGYRVAARDCSGCHSIEKLSDSPRSSAPPFRDIRRRYNEISMQREFEAIREVGHYEMPPTPISLSDGRDITAYIESLAER
jgi:mono/diheme cytochrome c family protein